MAEIYVACLDSYVAGKLVGDWLDLDDYSDADELAEAIKAIVEEEWAIHDYSEFPNLGENPDLETIMEVYELMQEKGDNGLEIVQAAINYDGQFQNMDFVRNTLENYQGCYESEKAFAEEYCSQLEMWEKLKEIQLFDGVDASVYLDTERIARDLFISYYWDAPASDGIHVFSRSFGL